MTMTVPATVLAVFTVLAAVVVSPSASVCVAAVASGDFRSGCSS
jgi:hypothetical protein